MLSKSGKYIAALKKEIYLQIWERLTNLLAISVGPSDVAGWCNTLPLRGFQNKSPQIVISWLSPQMFFHEMNIFGQHSFEYYDGNISADAT